MLSYSSFASSTSNTSNSTTNNNNNNNNEEKKQPDQTSALLMRQETPHIPIEDDIVRQVEQEAWYQQSLLVVIVGASGDLAKKKTYPALLDLFVARLLPFDVHLVGFARSSKSSEEFRDHLRPFLCRHLQQKQVKQQQSKQVKQQQQQQQVTHEATQQLVDHFLSRCSYRSGSSYADHETLGAILNDTQCHNTLVYLAIPPHVFADCTGAVQQARSQQSNQHCHHIKDNFFRVVLEKPFGRDTDTCRDLLQALQQQDWPEESLYRIDHYLGKEMVQNLAILRRDNAWVQALWSNQVVQSVHIVWKEAIGTQGRGGYFDDIGILRDVIQNHLLQVLTLVAMELPDNVSDNNSNINNIINHKWTADDIRNQKVQVLQRMPILTMDDVLLGQYEGYADDPTIPNKDTTCPTYACVKMTVNTPRWQGVPFVLEAGKALDDALCEVRLHFKGSNALVLRLQPVPKLYLTTHVKTPGFSSTPTTSQLTACYQEHVADLPGAYTRLLLNVLRGQQENFVRHDELLAAWRLFTPLLHQLEDASNGDVNNKPHLYRFGSSGPDLRHDFLKQAGVTPPGLPLASAL